MQYSLYLQYANTRCESVFLTGLVMKEMKKNLYIHFFLSFINLFFLHYVTYLILQVLSQLGSFIDQYCWQMMDRVWLLICSCLEGGDEKLKVAALGAVTVLIDSCSVPKSNEVRNIF